MVVLRAIFLVILSSLILGCNNNKMSDFKSRLNIIDDKIQVMKNQIKSIEQMQFNLFVQNANITNSTAVFDPTAKGFERIYTENGIFIIALGNIVEYANGYKVLFLIGNPNAAKYSNTDVTIFYGKARAADEDYSDWKNSLKTLKTNINKVLLSGVWNNVDFILSPANKDDLSYISISINPHSIQLTSDYRNESS